MEDNTHVSSDAQMKLPYEAPKAEIILLAPNEKLAVWDFEFHDGQFGDRWALNNWAEFGVDGLGDASGVTGTVSPTDWAISSESTT